MTLRLAAEHLRLLAARSHLPGCERLATAVDSVAAEVMVTKTVRASELLPTYLVRLRRWEEEGEPPSVGFPEFVQALETLGDSDVAITRYAGPECYFVLLFSAGLDTLIGCIAIEQEPTDNGSQHEAA